MELKISTQCWKRENKGGREARTIKQRLTAHIYRPDGIRGEGVRRQRVQKSVPALHPLSPTSEPSIRSTIPYRSVRMN